jgi:hypothetical protein
MVADDLPIIPGVETLGLRDAVVSIDIRAVGKYLYLTPVMARRLASHLIVYAMQAEELNKVPGLPAEPFA